MRRAFVLVCLVATSSIAAPAERGLLSGVGVGLMGLGLGLAGFGLSQQLIASNARLALGAYSVPTAPEAPAVATLLQRSQSGTAFALVGLIGGGLAIAGGIVCLVLDRPAPPVTVVPLPGGGLVGLTLGF